MITLDFIGVTLRLFQSLGNLTSTMNQIINSHLHIEKFYEIDNNKIELNKENFQIHSASTIEVSNLDFGYFNSDVNIYSDINFSIKKDHTLLLPVRMVQEKVHYLDYYLAFYMPKMVQLNLFQINLATLTQ